MLVPNKRQMREINERSPDLTKAIAYWTIEAARMGLISTAAILHQAALAAALDITDARNLFAGSGRRRTNKPS